MILATILRLDKRATHHHHLLQNKLLRLYSYLGFYFTFFFYFSFDFIPNYLNKYLSSSSWQATFWPLLFSHFDWDNLFIIYFVSVYVASNSVLGQWLFYACYNMWQQQHQHVTISLYLTQSLFVALGKIWVYFCNIFFYFYFYRFHFLLFFIRWYKFKWILMFGLYGGGQFKSFLRLPHTYLVQRKSCCVCVRMFQCSVSDVFLV